MLKIHANCVAPCEHQRCDSCSVTVGVRGLEVEDRVALRGRDFDLF